VNDLGGVVLDMGGSDPGRQLAVALTDFTANAEAEKGGGLRLTR
jgi:hypothetical protein